MNKKETSENFIHRLELSPTKEQRLIYRDMLVSAVNFHNYILQKFINSQSYEDIPDKYRYNKLVLLKKIKILYREHVKNQNVAKNIPVYSAGKIMESICDSLSKRRIPEILDNKSDKNLSMYFSFGYKAITMFGYLNLPKTRTKVLIKTGSEIQLDIFKLSMLTYKGKLFVGLDGKFYFDIFGMRDENTLDKFGKNSIVRIYTKKIKPTTEQEQRLQYLCDLYDKAYQVSYDYLLSEGNTEDPPLSAIRAATKNWKKYAKENKIPLTKTLYESSISACVKDWRSTKFKHNDRAEKLQIYVGKFSKKSFRKKGKLFLSGVSDYVNIHKLNPIEDVLPYSFKVYKRKESFWIEIRCIKI